ncbi:hypothetical protein FHS83_000280 [Rhizomicrobium palustre]|uniref:Phytoene synthase n=1 Tax=Rhizomicrobium palustre TaxID=189966 RepID=A0A846MV28_9PROT|nr:squalene/phytoene synthase family protein [Rhizomicrobium palustre]NIK86962.1 hypothetical protein [Rhizomicrobium palustre]
MAEDFFDACEQTVRRHDPDRYFAALFAPEAQRRHLFVLAALYYELAHVSASVREPMIGAIRFAWWRETVEGARAGKPREHVVAKALAQTFAEHDLPQALFDTLIEGWNALQDLAPDEAVANAEARIGALMRLGAMVCGVPDIDCRDAAIAYGLAGQSEHAALAQTHYNVARKKRIPKAVLPVVMPASLTPLYLKRADPPLWRKQIAYLRCAVTGKI